MKQELIDFEQEIADLYKDGKIKYPIHLRGGCEDNLIDIFKDIKKEDWIFSYWASHIHCLLKGVPKDELKQAILKGNSIALSFPEYNIYCSGIVGSLAGVAVGTAYGLKKQKSTSQVYLFTGDMGAELGIFNESFKYSHNFDLPIKFIVEDNGVSVLTNTEKVWGYSEASLKGYYKLIKYNYKNKWPHSGIGQRIAF